MRPHSPVRERAIPRGTPYGGGDSHLVGMRNYFCPDDTQVRQRVSGEVVVENPVVCLSLFKPLNNQAEVAARGRYKCKFLAHDEGHHVNVPVVRPDTHPTPRTPVPHDEH